MRNKKSKIITFSILIIAVICSVIFAVGATDNTTKEYWKVVPMDVDTYRTDLNNKKAPIYGEAGEWLFAGWFTDEACTKAIASDMKEGSAYAKFVPADILGLKAQVNIELSDDDTTNDDYEEDGVTNAGAIRFVTSVDTLDYSSIGFKIKRGERDVEDRASNKVYQRLYATGKAADGTGKTDDFVPSELFNADASTYFKTWTYTKVPSSAYDMEITVTPYWITLDGTTVTANQGMKTVNQGRSWEYVYVDDAGSDETGVGTRELPYKTLDKALSEMKANYKAQSIESKSSDTAEGKDGIVCIKDSLTGASGFSWDDHDMDVIITSDVADISKFDISDISTVVDASTLDLSAVQTVKVGDGVTFANMTLKLFGSASQNGAVYATGNRFKIAVSVTSENPYTVVYGGGSGTNVSGTDVTILSGSYRLIYGGGRNSNVTGDTHVTLENTNVFDTTAGGEARVHGGCNKGTVEGDTHVTIGKGFNSSTEFNYATHSKYATVWGGGYGDDADTMSIVKGSTYVTVKDDAKANFISGGGFLYSEVQKTSHVIFEGGYAMSIYGGSAGSSKQENLDNDANGKSANTAVVMSGGEVQQVFGGNEFGNLEGNTNVQILGGTVTRRIFGGCYNGVSASSWNNAFSVAGNSSVTIGTNANVNLSDYADHSLCAVSRLETNSEDETGILVLNPGKENLDYGFELTTLAGHAKLATNFLVTVDTGGSVTTENGVLQIKADNASSYVTVTDVANNNVLSCMQGEGACQLPKLATRSDEHKITVTFSSTEPDLSQYKARVESNAGKAYYYTLAEAVAMANMRTDETTVTLLADATIDSTLAISDSANMTVQSETGATYTVTYANTENNLFDVEGKLAIDNLKLAGGKSSIYMKNGSEVIATDVNITRLNATDEALVVINEGSSFTLNGTDETSSINGNNLVGRGVKVLGTFVLNGGTIKNNTVTNVVTENEDETTSTEVVPGAGVYLGGTFVMNGGTIQNNSVEYDGAGVHVADSGNFTLNAGTIQNNNASQSGAGVSVRGAFTMTGGTIQKNSATNHGAGVMAREDAILNLSGGTITTNTATKNGGGIYIQSNNATAISGVTIESNIAADGGGVYVNPKAGTATVTVSAGTIQRNTATNGAGVYVNTGTFEMTGGTISGYGTSDARISSTGAGVYVVSGATFDMNGENAVIENNYSSQVGAGVYVEGTFTMNDGTIQGNNTTGNGAGVLVKPAAVFTMSGGTITNNTTSKNGGGLFTQSTTTTITGGTIESNTATGTITDETLSDGNGGGVYVHANGILTLEDGNIKSNTAAGNGGGIYIATTAADATSNITGGVIDANNATDGAGIYFNTSKAVAMSDVTIQNNIALQNGGGIYVYSTSAFHMTSGTITENTAVNGGGVYTDNKGIFTLKGGDVTSNTATGNGSGVCVSANNNKPFTMSGGTISGHGTSDARSNSIGAGVYVASGSVFNMNGENAVIENNYSTKSGAGVAVAGTFTMTKGTIQGNGTTVKGAGVYVIDGTFNLNGGSIMNHGDATNSVAGASEGAGVYAAGTGVVTMTAGNISNNYVSGSGAGISVDGTAQFTMEGGLINNNTAKASGGGMVVRSKKTEIIDEVETLVAAFVMNGGTISDNEALVEDKNGGGAIFQSGGTMIEITGGEISGNRAESANGGAIFANPGSTSKLKMTGGTIKENIAALNGAGVYVNSGTFDMQGGTISNHGTADSRSTSVGAGVYVVNGATFNMNGETASIENNYSSQTGAGVATAGTFILMNGTIQGNDTNIVNAGGAGVHVLASGSFTMSGGKIHENYVTHYGGGIYQEGELTIAGGEITENHATIATEGKGGAIYTVSGADITMTGGKIANNYSKANGGAVFANGDNTIKLEAGEISGNTAGGTVQGVFVQNAKNTSQVTLYTTFIMGNEIRYNSLDARNTDNPILILKGSIPDNYVLQLGFHKTGTVYIQCDSEEIAAQVYPIIEKNQFGTYWTLSHEDGSSYIKATKQ